MKLSELRFQGTFRDYQQKVLDDSKSYLEDGKIHIVAAPGSGKTTLGLEFICRLGKPALVLAPSITIRQQWGERFTDAFLPEGEQPESYISYHISDPRAITCITYQALYSAMTGKDSEETDEEETEDEANLLRAGAHTASQSRLDVAAIIKQKHITTICLDEAPSKLRNPILADVFGRMRLMERRGSGFKKILDAYEAEERYKEELKPVFYTDGYNFFLTLWNLNYAYDKAQNKAQKSQMTDREYILLLLKENPSLTQVELSEMIDKSRRTVQMLMKELLDEGVIERIGSKKKGSWLVK